jgi:hypothetical protein
MFVARTATLARSITFAAKALATLALSPIMSATKTAARRRACLWDVLWAV